MRLDDLFFWTHGKISGKSDTIDAIELWGYWFMVILVTQMKKIDH